MAKDSLNLRNRAEVGKTRFAQTVPHLFSARLRKFKAPSRAQTSKEKGQPIARLAFSFGLAPEGVALSFDFPALDGALNFCCREEKEGRPV